LKNKKEKFTVHDVLCLLEVTQILQFTKMNEEIIKTIERNMLFTIRAVSVYFVASKLGLKTLSDKARIYILYNFKTLLTNTKCRMMFYKNTNKDDLKILLSDNRMNVDNETDIYNLIIEWCLQTKNYDMEYEIAANCVHFNLMNTNQLLSCLLITKDINLKKTINHYRNLLKNNERSMSYAIKPKRSILFELCAMKIEDLGVYLYRWDRNSLKFIRFLKVDPLTKDRIGYCVAVRSK